MFQWDSESEKATVGIGCNSENTLSRFSWRSWKDGFMGRIFAQSELRSTRLRIKYEELQKKRPIISFNESSGEFQLSVMSIEQWPRWFSIPTHLTRYYMEDGSTSDNDEYDIDTSLEGECECGCKAHSMFLEAKERMDSGDEMGALELFRNCIVDHGHYRPLQHFAGSVIGKIPLNMNAGGWLLDTMASGMCSFTCDYPLTC